MRTFIFFVIGAVLIGLIAYLGILTSNDPSYVVWFGLATALLAPAAFSIISYGFSSGDRKILRHLATVPDVEKLIDEAKTQKEKIKILQKEKNELQNVVKLEAKKQFLLEQKKVSVAHGIEILSNLSQIDKNLNDLNIKIEQNSEDEDIRKLHERLAFKKEGGFELNIFGLKMFFNLAAYRKLDPVGALLIGFIVDIVQLSRIFIIRK